MRKPECKVELIHNRQPGILLSISNSITVMKLNEKIRPYATSAQEEMVIGWPDASIPPSASASTAFKPKESVLECIVWKNTNLTWK